MIYNENWQSIEQIEGEISFEDSLMWLSFKMCDLIRLLRIRVDFRTRTKNFLITLRVVVIILSAS
jgi:hypothetical protein